MKIIYKAVLKGHKGVGQLPQVCSSCLANILFMSTTFYLAVKPPRIPFVNSVLSIGRTALNNPQLAQESTCPGVDFKSYPGVQRLYVRQGIKWGRE